MRNLIALLIISLLAGCGGAGSGSGDLSAKVSTAIIRQDLVCLSDNQELIPPAQSITVTLTRSQEESEFQDTSDLQFEGCTVSRVVPDPGLPQEAVELAKEIKLVCTPSDIPSGESTDIQVEVDDYTLNRVRQAWESAGKSGFWGYTVDLAITYTQGDQKFTKVIPLKIIFGNYVNEEGDECQFGG